MTLCYEDAEILIHKLKCGPYDNNAYVLISPESNESIIIDTPAEPDKVLEITRGTKVRAILITHNHMDHLLGFVDIKDNTGADVGIHPEDAHALPTTPEFYLEHGDEFKVGTITVKVIHTPGHTPGAICLLVGKHLISGDTLFPGGPGKTRSAQDLQQIIQSITAELFVLEDDIKVLPGHGDDTTLKASKEAYQVFESKTHSADLYGDISWMSS